MGEVYRARDTRLGRELAIKILPREMAADENRLSRFEKEARLASSLNHPNIITIYDIGRAGSVPYIVMELIAGKNLRERLASGPMAIGEILGIAAQIADGLAKAHEAGIVHRDLKPENLMITNDGYAKILDFGLGKQHVVAKVSQTSTTVEAATEMTTPGTVLGTVDYMSPEQAAGLDADFRSDQFSFGSVLYELSTGVRPFHRDSAVQTMSAIIQDNPRLVESLNPAVPEGFRKIIERCLEKDPRNRFSSTYDLAADLRSQSLLVNSGSALSLPRRKNFRFAGIVAGIALSAIVVSAWIPWDSVRRLFQPKSEGIARNAPAQKNLAILPLRATGGESQMSIFADGLTESITAKLTQLTFLPSLQVSPASEIRSRQVDSPEKAKNLLGANLVLTGTIARSGDVLQVTCSLIEAGTARPLEEKICASASDPLALQDQLVAAIVQLLGLDITPEVRDALQARDTKIASAKESYLQARGYFQSFDKPENVDRAISILENALKADPNYAAAYAAMGQAYWAKSERTKETKWIGEAQKMCERALSLEAKLAPGHSCLAVVHRASGRYDEAVKAFQQALEIEPTNDDLYRELARTQVGIGKTDEAVKTFQQAIALRPHYWANYNSLGVFYFERGRSQEAAQMFERVVNLAPDCLFGYSNLGAAYLQLGRYGDAIPMFERSVAIRPTAVAYSNLATAYFGRRRFLESAQTFEQAVKLTGNNYTIWGNLGDAYYWAPGKRVQAEDAYRKAIALGEESLKINPLDAEALSKVAGYYAMIGERQPALNLVGRALRTSPANSNVRYKAALIHNQFNEVGPTLDSLEKAVAEGFSVTIIRDTPNFDHLWPNQRFQQLLRGN